MGRKNIAEAGLLGKAESICSRALSEVDPENLIRNNVRLRGHCLSVQGQEFSLDNFRNIYLAAIGKAAPYMAEGILKILGRRITEGIVLHRSQESRFHGGIHYLPASHPLPDRKSLEAAQAIVALAKKATEEDLFLVLISGGGSAQACLPLPGISLEEKSRITKMLMEAGADIRELNTVRKHLSSFKGGRLAEAIFPAVTVNLIISDVIGNDLESIASGPTHWDTSCYKDAFSVLKKYKLWNAVPASAKKVISDGIEGRVPETLKRENPVFRNVFKFIIGDNRTALGALQEQAKTLGFWPLILTSSDRGEAREAARKYAALLASAAFSNRKTHLPLCLLAGGELTVTVRGKGKGGRNTEFVLALLMEMEACFPRGSDWLVLSMGTDGVDGPTDAAGAWAGPLSMKKAIKMSLQPERFLEDNDAYSFFKKLGGLIVTGPTRTNVMDIRLFLLDSK